MPSGGDFIAHGFASLIAYRAPSGYICGLSRLREFIKCDATQKDSIAPGEGRAFTFTLRMPSGVRLMNQAIVDPFGLIAERDKSNNTDAVTMERRAPDLTIRQTCSPSILGATYLPVGTVLAYEIVLYNFGRTSELVFVSTGFPLVRLTLTNLWLQSVKSNKLNCAVVLQPTPATYDGYCSAKESLSIAVGDKLVALRFTAKIVVADGHFTSFAEVDPNHRIIRQDDRFNHHAFVVDGTEIEPHSKLTRWSDCLPRLASGVNADLPPGTNWACDYRFINRIDATVPVVIEPGTTLVNAQVSGALSLKAVKPARGVQCQVQAPALIPQGIVGLVCTATTELTIAAGRSLSIVDLSFILANRAGFFNIFPLDGSVGGWVDFE